MTTRLLPRDEWPRLVNTELEVVWPLLRPDAQIVVVEDDAGGIIGCWAAFTQVHVEGVWVAPGHRGRSSVARHLLTGMRRLLASLGAQTVATAALSDEVRSILDGLGATKLPGDHYALSL